MSSIATVAHLRRATSQLPVSWYCDPAIYAAEQRMLFPRAPSYVGHELMAPNVGDYCALESRDNAQALVRNADGIELVSNICRHRQAIMLKGRGNDSHIVCPIHRWTYDLKGELLGAPHFADKPCLDLGRSPLTNWHGLLFDGKRDVHRDLAALPRAHLRLLEPRARPDRDPRVQLQLEDLHRGLPRGLPRRAVPPGPRPVRHLRRPEVGVRRLVLGADGGREQRLARPGSAAYARWHKAVVDYYRGETPPYGAIWMVYYPNIMLEWYPHVLIVSTLIPRGVDRTTNVVEFYYPEEIALFEREFVEAEQAAYMETAREDDEIAERMDAGRNALYRQGRSEEGPYQSPMEDGMQHFHEFLRRELEPHSRRADR